jgi:hypothetical protein
MWELVPPALVLGVLLVVGYAALLHLWGGRSLQELFLYLASAAIGFAVGQLVGMLLQMPLPRIGQIHVVEASIFAWLALLGAREWAGARRASNP